jgi:hypothetical protein
MERTPWEIRMPDVKGMVQVAGATYRIVKVAKGKYDVIRILDEERVGTFETFPRVKIDPVGVPEKLLMEIALTALKQAKISWQKMQAPRAPKSAPAMKVPSTRPSQTRMPASSRTRAAKPT